MATVYGDTPTSQRLVTRETETGMFVILLSALAQLMERTPGLSLPSISPFASVPRWATDHVLRFSLQVSSGYPTELVRQLAWARAIGATHFVVQRGHDDPDTGTGSHWVHAYYLGTVGGVPVCVWGAWHDLETLPWPTGTSGPIEVLDAALARAEQPIRHTVAEEFAAHDEQRRALQERASTSSADDSDQV